MTTWALVGLVVAAALYFIQVPPESTGPPGSGTNYVRLYEVALNRLATLISPSAAPPKAATPPLPGAATGAVAVPLTTAVPAPHPNTLTSVPPAKAAAPSAASNLTEGTSAAPPLPASASASTAVTSALTPPAAKASPQPDPTHPWTNSLGMRFVPVPATRTLFAVWETRRADYDAFIQASAAHRVYSLRPPPFLQTHPDEPVVKVSWSNAVAFCRWLTDAEHKKGLLAPGQAYRLPSDREWSLTVGLSNESGRTLSERITRSRLNESYPWGTAWPPPRAAGNFRGTETRSPTAIARYDDGAPFTAIVGRFGTNRFGLADLSGNVWEWCLQEAGEPLRVARGGAWDTSDPRELRSAHRYTLTPGTELDSLGFRCVIDLGE